MPTLDELKGNLLGLADDLYDVGVTDGSTSRDEEVAALNAKVAELEAELAKTQVPDYPEVSTEVALRAAITLGSAVTVNTKIQANSPLRVPTTGAAIYLGPNGYIERNFDNPGGSTRQSLFVNGDWTKPIQGFELTGPGKLGSAGGIHGNLIGVWADDIYFRDWSVDYWTGGRLFIGGGERQDVEGITAQVAEGSGSGAGGWRTAIGSGRVAHCDITSGDDVYQTVPAGGKGDPLLNKGDIHDFTYEDCVGRSYTGRLMDVGNQGAGGITVSIRNVVFRNVTGFGGGSGVNVANHEPSTGSITGISFPGCRVDQSQAGTPGEPNHGQPSEFYVLRDPGTGVVDDIDASEMTMVLSTRIAGRTKPLYQPKGAIGSSITPPAAA